MSRPSLYQQVTDQILEQLEAGTVPWVRPWQAGNGNPFLPANARTGRPYSGVNVLILWAQAANRGYDDNRWLTYKQAQEIGGQVRKGEKGTHIILVKSVPKKQREEGEGEFYTMLRHFTVFNVAQIDGLELSASEQPERSSGTDFLDGFGARIRYGGDRAAYQPLTDSITLPPPAAFTSDDNLLATGLHELVHWTGHKDRLDRFNKETPYAEEELVAELGAAYLCAGYGIEGHLQHAEYISHWTKRLQEDNRAIFRVARRAEEAAEYLRACHAERRVAA